MTENKLTRAEALRRMREFHYPSLDALRAEIPTLPTSDLLGFMLHPEVLAEKLLPAEVFALPEDTEKAIAAAAMAALAEEIDARVPPRTAPP